MKSKKKQIIGNIDKITERDNSGVFRGLHSHRLLSIFCSNPCMTANFQLWIISNSEKVASVNLRYLRAFFSVQIQWKIGAKS